MSSSDWLAKMSQSSVRSEGSLRIARMTCDVVGEGEASERGEGEVCVCVVREGVVPQGARGDRAGEGNNA